MDTIRKAMRFATCFWGGMYNPLIPIDDEDLARTLLERFCPDALFSACPATEADAFIDRFTHFPWPVFPKSLWATTRTGHAPNFVDIEMALHTLPRSDLQSVDITRKYLWADADPLQDVFLARYGDYPPDYPAYNVALQARYNSQLVQLAFNEPLPTSSFLDPGPLQLTALNLTASLPLFLEGSAVYVGDSSSADDILRYWNLRALGIDAAFHDPNHASRLRPALSAFLSQAKANDSHRPRSFPVSFTYWSRCGSNNKPIDLGLGDAAVYLRQLAFTSTDIGRVDSPTVDASEVLASMDATPSYARMTFELPQKPAITVNASHMAHLVLSVDTTMAYSSSSALTFDFPHIPELNLFYGQTCYGRWNQVRSSPNGLAFIIPAATFTLTFNACNIQDLFVALFKALGIKSNVSTPGLVTSRLIQQMGGLQGCRVFKIRGVRNLIWNHSPEDAITKSMAQQTIADVDAKSNKPRFSDFESLYIEYRTQPKLTPQAVFDYLVKMRLYRAGLNVKCDICQLEFWIGINSLGETITCEYCGNAFLLTPQLRDRDWRYRPSGLLATKNRQHGSIPVAITLQQLETVLSFHGIIYATGIKLDPNAAKILSCELDFTVLTRSVRGGTQLVLGECKGFGCIDCDDCDKLFRVAECCGAYGIETYVLFAKLSSFAEDELQLFRQLDARRRQRLILLTDRELEPYFIYERTSKETGIRETAVGLEDLAVATQAAFLNENGKS